ncbi:hypothetical protein [Mesorhizobium sp. WSM3224]|uniref:hypothetical protein n=1 Tax=Mesorhizobium sp. WSM3224 TaxID=1040986 RepID=UPI0012EBF1B6|nr:hypothetical protein [Mesorhizobium sp. WSM3224]
MANKASIALAIRTSGRSTARATTTSHMALPSANLRGRSKRHGTPKSHSCPTPF